MGNFAENLNLGNRFRPPWHSFLILLLRQEFAVETDFAEKFERMDFAKLMSSKKQN